QVRVGVGRWERAGWTRRRDEGGVAPAWGSGPRSSVASEERYAELREAARGRADVATQSKARDAALALGEGGEEQRPVRDALVAGHAHARALERTLQRAHVRLHARIR